MVGGDAGRHGGSDHDCWADLLDRDQARPRFGTGSAQCRQTLSYGPTAQRTIRAVNRQFARATPRSESSSCRSSLRKAVSSIPVAASMVDYGTSRRRNPRWSSPDPPACLLGGPVRPIVRRKFITSPPRPGTCRRSAAMNGARCSAGCVASTYSTCFATSSNPAARYSSPHQPRRRLQATPPWQGNTNHPAIGGRGSRRSVVDARRSFRPRRPPADPVTTASALSYALNQ